MVGKLSRSTLSVSITGSANNSASRTISATDSGFRPAVPAYIHGLRASMSHWAARIRGIGIRGARDAEFAARGKISFAGKLEHRAFTRDREINGTLGFAHRHLEQPADDQTRIVLVLQAMVDLGVLSENRALIPWLLYPLDCAVAGAGN